MAVIPDPMLSNDLSTMRTYRIDETQISDSVYTHRAAAWVFSVPS